MNWLSPRDASETGEPSAAVGEQPARTLAGGELLFGAGEAKTQLYRVEAGVICLYAAAAENRGVVEFAFPGDLVGLGFLETQTLNARAMVETRVSTHPLSTLTDVASGSARARSRLADAIERELDARRWRLRDAGKANPVEALAALLVNLSCNNTYEGRDASLITDAWNSGTIAEMLGTTVEDLAATLVQLERWDLVDAADPRGLRLTDIDALEALADGTYPPKAAMEGRGRDAKARPPKLPHACAAAA